MNWRVISVLCVLTAVFAAFGVDEGSIKLGTNAVASGATNDLTHAPRSPLNAMLKQARPGVMVTNLTAKCSGSPIPTNLTFTVFLSDGTATNQVFPLPLHAPEDLVRRASPANRPQLGDFWLPGEFEKLLKQKREERRAKEHP